MCLWTFVMLPRLMAVSRTTRHSSDYCVFRFCLSVQCGRSFCHWSYARHSVCLALPSTLWLSLACIQSAREMPCWFVTIVPVRICNQVARPGVRIRACYHIPNVPVFTKPLLADIHRSTSSASGERPYSRSLRYDRTARSSIRHPTCTLSHSRE
jgi:hypothetical protein